MLMHHFIVDPLSVDSPLVVKLVISSEIKIFNILSKYTYNTFFIIKR